MKKNLYFLLLIGILPSFYNVQGQGLLKEYQDKYPEKNGVFISKSADVNISINKEGVPTIVIDHAQERMFLNDNYKYYIEQSISYSSFEKIKALTPIVHIPEDGKFKKIKINEIKEESDWGANVFHDDLKKYTYFYSGLVKGGKTSLTYTEELFEPHFFGTFFFSSYLPVESSKYSVATPSDMEITFKLFGDEKEKVRYTVVTEGKNKIHTWEAEGLKEFDSQSESVGIQHYATHLQLYINSYEFKKEKKYVLRNLDDLYKYYRDFVRKVNSEESVELKKLADSLTVDKTTTEEKVKAIFYWVQDNIKYVAFEDGLGGFIPRKASLVCDRKYGDCKDMTSILYSMLNSVGIDAYYTWIGTRDIPYSYFEVPTPSSDNHMICSYKNGEDYIFLDATGKGLPYGTPTAFIQGKEALVGISEEEYKIVKVPEYAHNLSYTVDTVYMELQKDLVIGKATVTYGGYSASYLSTHINNMNEEEKEEFYKYAFKKGNNKCTSTVTELRGLDVRETPLEIDYKFEIPDYIRENGDELYLNPYLKKYLGNDKINLERNTIDKERVFKEVNRNVIFIKIPEDYDIDYMPESVSYKHDKFSCDLTIKHLKESNEIEIQSYFDYDYLLLTQEDFPAWNEMIAVLNNAYSELIILKKKG